jgi:hypothetical protein
MYINGKMIPIETILGKKGRGIREKNEGGKFIYDIS